MYSSAAEKLLTWEVIGYLSKNVSKYLCKILTKVFLLRKPSQFVVVKFISPLISLIMSAAVMLE